MTIWVFLFVATAGVMFYLGWRCGARDALRPFGTESLQQALRERDAASTDVKLFHGVVGTFHDVYCEDLRPSIAEWVDDWPEFDWGEVGTFLKKAPPSFEAWLNLWRWDTMCRYEGYRHRFAEAILELHAAAAALEDLVTLADRDDVLKEHSWGTSQLMDALRTVRALVPHLESPRTEGDEPPDLDAAIDDADSDDETEADAHRRHTMEELARLGQAAKDLAVMEIDQLSIQELNAQESELRAELSDPDIEPDEADVLREELERIASEIARRAEGGPE